MIVSMPDPALSAYQRSILNKIIPYLDAAADFNFYKLIENAVSCKCILPSRNALVMETYYALKEYLLTQSMIAEKEEMTAYALTEYGKQLITYKTIELFEKHGNRQQKKSIIQSLLTHTPFFSRTKGTVTFYE